jgi:hypothetical protein
MFIKSKAVAAAVALAVVGGVGTAGAMSAGAATPSCGHRCIDVFSRQFGTHRSPNFLLDVFRQGLRVGQPIILFRSSNSDPGEDFTAAHQGSVAGFYAAKLVSAAVALHYGCIPAGHPRANFPDCRPDGTNNRAFEFEYAPVGVESGLCAGLAAAAFQNERVTLQPCGVSARTIWILDSNGSRATFRRGYLPLINGSDTNFSHPFVLTYPKNGRPTDRPRRQLLVQKRTGFSRGRGKPIRSVQRDQLWGADMGVRR